MTTAKKVSAFLATADLAVTRDDDDVAAAMGMSIHQLRHRLRGEGTRYGNLLRDERMRRCKALLSANPHADGHGIARRCGYAASNQAYRAFRQWFGVTLNQAKHKKALTQ